MAKRKRTDNTMAKRRSTKGQTTYLFRKATTLKLKQIYFNPEKGRNLQFDLKQDDTWQQFNFDIK